MSSSAAFTGNRLASSFSRASLSVNGAAPAVGSPVIYDSLTVQIGPDIGYDTSTGTFSLAAGRIYQLMGSLRASLLTPTTGFYAWRWFNLTSGSFIGSQAFSAELGGASGDGPKLAEATLFTSVPTQVQLRTELSSGTVNLIAVNSWATAQTVASTISSAGSSPSYVRRTGGTLKGSTNTNVVRWSTAAELAGTDITYVADSVNGDSFLVNTTGIYSVSCSGQRGPISLDAFQLGVSPSITNTFGGADTRATLIFPGAGGGDGCLSWTGPVSAGSRIYIRTSAAMAGAVENQITVTRVDV